MARLNIRQDLPSYFRNIQQAPSIPVTAQLNAGWASISIPPIQATAQVILPLEAALNTTGQQVVVSSATSLKDLANERRTQSTTTTTMKRRARMAVCNPTGVNIHK